MRTLEIFRLLSRKPCLIGRISPNESIFEYDTSYLESPDAQPLSLSLPLRQEPFKEAHFKPYFEGLSQKEPHGKPLLLNCRRQKATIYPYWNSAGVSASAISLCTKKGNPLSAFPSRTKLCRRVNSRPSLKTIARWQTRASLLVSPSQEPKTKLDWRTCRQPPWTKAGSDLKDSRGRLTY